jgi:hypothetical protein
LEKSATECALKLIECISQNLKIKLQLSTALTFFITCPNELSFVPCLCSMSFSFLSLLLFFYWIFLAFFVFKDNTLHGWAFSVCLLLAARVQTREYKQLTDWLCSRKKERKRYLRLIYTITIYFLRKNTLKC